MAQVQIHLITVEITESFFPQKQVKLYLTDNIEYNILPLYGMTLCCFKSQSEKDFS